MLKKVHNKLDHEVEEEIKKVPLYLRSKINDLTKKRIEGKKYPKKKKAKKTSDAAVVAVPANAAVLGQGTPGIQMIAPVQGSSATS